MDANVIEQVYKNAQSKHNLDELNYLFYKAVAENPQDWSHNLRRARIDSMILDNYSIEINSFELLAGRFSTDFILDDEKQKIIELGKQIEKSTGVIGGIYTGETGHRTVNFRKILTQGIGTVLNEIDTHLSQIDERSSDAAEKRAFYTSCKISLEAMCRFAKRFRSRLLLLANNEQDGKRRSELIRMADNFKKAPLEPCTGFYEALQCMWFVQFAMRLVTDSSMTGRIDSYLYPFYEKDLKDGTITKEFAFNLIEHLFLKHNEIYGTWPGAVMVGGVDRKGEPVWNDLTRMCVDAIETTGLVNPSVAVCYTEDMPEDLLARCVQMIAKGYTRPSLFNDKLIQKGLRNVGVADEDSRDYINSTCVEITTSGNSNINVATPYINIDKAFEYILGNHTQIFGEECHVDTFISFELCELDTFDKFKDLTKTVTAEIIRTCVTKECETLYARSKYTSCPMASPFIDDCLALGKDAVAGGARYNYVYPCFPGFINFIDALAAVKNAVYDKKIISLEQLSSYCMENFQTAPQIRTFLLNKCEKFGNGCECVDEIGIEMYDFIYNELKKYNSYIGAHFYPSYFAWKIHGVMGAQSAATPDGRLQGEALSENLGAVQGMDRNGPSGVLESISKLDQSLAIGGVATNFRFSKSFATSKKGQQAIIDFIKAFMKSNCFEIQFNVVNQQDLLSAKKNPEKYKTLMVRVAGFSDYFVDLSEEIQNEIIKRTEHGD